MLRDSFHPASSPFSSLYRSLWQKLPRVPHPPLSPCTTLFFLLFSSSPPLSNKWSTQSSSIIRITTQYFFLEEISHLSKCHQREMSLMRHFAFIGIRCNLFEIQVHFEKCCLNEMILRAWNEEGSFSLFKVHFLGETSWLFLALIFYSMFNNLSQCIRLLVER